jgi:hypothetical protein
MSYKQERKKRCRILPHQNKGTQKQQTPTIQVESNIQFLIEQCVNVMPHQMKGIRDERQDVCLLPPNIWRTMLECSDQVSLKGFIFVVLCENMLHYSIKTSSSGH